jgi:HrpA-like RNA helicase
MLRTPLQQLCLSIKALSPTTPIAATLAAAPTPPEPSSVELALAELCALRAIDPATELMTPLGRHLAHMPVGSDTRCSPRNRLPSDFRNEGSIYVR